MPRATGGERRHRRLEYGQGAVRAELRYDTLATTMLDDEIDDKRAGEEIDVTIFPHSRNERPFDLGPGGIATGVKHTASGMGRLSSEEHLAVRSLVEVRAEGSQPADGLRRALHQQSDRVWIAETRSRRERIRRV